MKKLTNINMGIDSMAKNYLAVHAKGIRLNMDYGKKVFPESEVNSRTGPIGSIELKRYPLNDGTCAEEFVQAILKDEEGKKLYFLGLEAHGKILIWPVAKIREKICSQICSRK